MVSRCFAEAKTQSRNPQVSTGAAKTLYELEPSCRVKVEKKREAEQRD